MSRGGSYGGGQSSLGYLFGSDQQPSAPPASPVVSKPPWGDDSTPEKAPDLPSPSQKPNTSNNYHRSEGQNTGNFITVSIPQVYLWTSCFVHEFSPTPSS